MSEEIKTGSRIVLDKNFWIEPESVGWSLRYEKINEGKKSHLSKEDKGFTTTKDVWYHGNIPACINSYIDKKMHSKFSNESEEYTPEELLLEIKIVLKGVEKRFGYLKHIGAEDSL